MTTKNKLIKLNEGLDSAHFPTHLNISKIRVKFE